MAKLVRLLGGKLPAARSVDDEIGVPGVHTWIGYPRRRCPPGFDHCMGLGRRSGVGFRGGGLGRRGRRDQKGRNKRSEGEPREARRKAPEGGGHLKNATG